LEKGWVKDHRQRVRILGGQTEVEQRCVGRAEKQQLRRKREIIKFEHFDGQETSLEAPTGEKAASILRAG